jgi:hypothetical protein
VLLAATSLAGTLLLRAISLLTLASSGQPADYGLAHQLMVALELDGFLLAATIGVQLRLLPPLARTRPVTGWVQSVGIGALALAVLARMLGIGLVLPDLATVGSWLAVVAVLALFWATGLGRRGIPPTVQAAATLLPGRTRLVLRVVWAGLLVSVLGRASGLLPGDTTIHAFTTIYLVPLILVVGVRMLPRISAYPIRFPVLCGALVWAGVFGGVLRAFGGPLGNVLGGAAGLGSQMGAQIGWLGGGVLTTVLLIFVALAWSPWGVPTGVPRTPEIMQIEVPKKSKAAAPDGA